MSMRHELPLIAASFEARRPLEGRYGWWPAIAALSFATDTTFTTLLLYAAIGTDANGHQTVPMALLMMGAMATACGWLLVGQAATRAGPRAGWIGAGVMLTLVSVLGAPVAQSFVPTLLPGIASFEGSGGGVVAAMVNLFAALVLGVLCSAPGATLAWAEVRLSAVWRFRARARSLKLIMGRHAALEAARDAAQAWLGAAAQLSDAQWRATAAQQCASAMALAHARSLEQRRSDIKLPKRARRAIDQVLERKEPKL